MVHVPSDSEVSRKRVRRTRDIRVRVHDFLAPRYWPDDPAMRPQYAEMVAIERLGELVVEQQAAAEAFRRACLQGQFCERLAAGMSRTDAAIAVGASRSSVYRWLKDEPGFRDAVTDAERLGAPFRLPPRTGRPIKLGRHTREAILRQLRQGATRGQAAVAAGVSRQTFYSWFKRFEEFREAVLAAEAEAR